MPENVPVVLIVDADPETHLVADGALPESECAIIGARSAEMGLKLAERRPPSVLVVDAKLGALGYLTERLRRISPHIHIVMLVPPDQATQAAAARLGGVGSMLRKPIEVTRLRSTVRTVLRLSAMSAGIKRMRGASGHEAEDPARPTPLPHTGAGRGK